MTEPKAFVKNAADPKQVEEAVQKEKTARELELDDLYWILSDIRGRRFMYRLFDFAGMNQESFAGELTHLMAKNEGRRCVGLKQMADLMEARPEAYIEMIYESKKLIRKRNRNA